MEQRTEDETLIRRYLLGEARDEEQEQTEQRLLTDRQYFQDFLRLEESLIDEYVQGGLNKHDQERFENYFMRAPERRESVEFAKALRRNLSQEVNLNSSSATGEEREGAGWSQPVFGFWQARSRAVMASLVCAVLMLGACAAWLLAERTRLKRQIEQLQSEQAKATTSDGQVLTGADGLTLGPPFDELEKLVQQLGSKLDEKEREIEKLKQANSSNQPAVNASVISLILVPELGRGEDEPNRVYLSKVIDRLRLKLEVDGENYKKYRAEVRTAEGEGILRNDNLKAKVSRSGKIVEVELAAKRFAKGDYMIVLSGATGEVGYEKISTYHFRVIRR